MEQERAAGSAFGALLRRYRLAAGLSQEALADRARLSVNGIGLLERGDRRTPQRETFALLAAALGLTPEERQAFEAAAARPALPRLRGKTSITVGPWPDAPSSNLPYALTTFIGREMELAELAALVRTHRLVTITGAGGVGKTQTALRAATAAGDGAEAGISFVGLASITDPSLVATAIAAALGVQEVPNHRLIETLIAFVGGKPMLLVLDNCEHVIAEAATVADSLRHGCPNLRILATSREPLRAAGERAYRLRPLDENDALMLFADRAQAADAHFVLADGDARIVASICVRLSRIPLAIELAAARVAVLPVPALAKALDDHFQVLIGGVRTAPPRQQTMRAAIDWSYELLTAPEQRLFERLSVFAGGCTIGAARAVGEGAEVARNDVLPLLSSLLSKSLVVMDLEGVEPRYRLLEPFREYAREKLTMRGESDATARRHALAYLDLAEQCGSLEMRSGHHTMYLGHARDEIGNWRVAVHWALLGRRDVLLGQRLVAVTVRGWGGQGAVLGDARRWLPVACDLVDEQTPSDVIAKLRLAEAYNAMHLDSHNLQVASAQMAIECFRGSNDKVNLMRALATAGNALYKVRRFDEARGILQEALSIARTLGSRWHTADVLRDLAACLDSTDFVASRAYLTEALQLYEAGDDQEDLEAAAIDVASLAYHEGDTEAAVRHLAELLAEGRQVHAPRRIIVLAQVSISQYLILLGRYQEAQLYARKALDAARAEHLDVLATQALGCLATIASLRTTSPLPGTHARAARILGFVTARLRSMGSDGALGSSTGIAVDAAFGRLREVMSAATLTDIMADGAQMTEDEAVVAATVM